MPLTIVVFEHLNLCDSICEGKRLMCLFEELVKEEWVKSTTQSCTVNQVYLLDKKIEWLIIGTMVLNGNIIF